MWKEQVQNVKSLVAKQKEKGYKKNIENLIVFLVLLIVTIIAVNTIWNEDEEKSSIKEDNTKKSVYVTQSDSKQNYENENSLEERLASILSKIEGVGNVNVLITYSETQETVAMYNENQKETATEEADTGGGTRTIKEKNYSKEVIYKEESGEKIPVTQKVMMPKIEGAVIIAQGARNADVRANIVQAVEAATGLATHKIQVFTMQNYNLN